MRVFIKICGLSTPRAVDAAVAAGADAVGFVFADSPRQITPERARKLCSSLSPAIIRVAVMRHPTPDEWQRVADEFEPDWLQTDVEDYASLDVAERFTCLPVYRDSSNLAARALHTAGEGLLLFEAATSGQGVLADWSQAATLANGRQLILAGGLTPQNVGEAIIKVRPFGVDVSSGVESRPGVKDVGRINAFMEAVRAAEMQVSTMSAPQARQDP